MFPYVELFGISIPTYGLLSVIGLLFASGIAMMLSNRRNVDVYNLVLTAMIGGVGVFIGAHLLFALTKAGDISKAFANYESYRSFWAFLKDIFNLSSGMVFYGGLYGGLLTGALFVNYKKYPTKDMSDVFACSIPLFHMFGRVGCYCAGCCYGIPFEQGVAGIVLSTGEKESIHRLPVQLIETVCLFVLFLVLVTLFVKDRASGRLMSIYLLSYGVIRFMLEFFRGDEVRGRLLMFSTSQWISLITIISVSAYLLLRKYKSKSKV